MKHWIGRRVVIRRREGGKAELEGTLKVWDSKLERIILSPGDVTVPFQSIVSIEPMNEKPVLNPIGYIIRHAIQFDNAVYFRSSVMVWKGDRLAAYRAVMTEHDSDTVTLDSGAKLRKDEHRFVVRSLRGQP